MGIFKKIVKGVKKAFKKIGKGIKKAVSKVGKFMGKIGIVGQIGLGLLLPGIGSMMGTMFSKLATGMMGSTFGIVRGAGQVINAAVNIGTGAGRLFSSITEGVTKVVGDLTGATLNKLGVTKIGSIDINSKTFSGAWETTKKAFHDVAAKGGDLFSMDTLTADNVFMKKAAEAAASGAVSPDGGVFDVPGMVETPVPEGTLGEAVEGFRAAQEVAAPAVDYSTFDPATGGTFVDATAQAAATQPSLLSKAGTALASRAKEAVTNIPGQFSQAAIANLTRIPRDAIVAGIQGPPQVTYDVRQAAIPDIGFAGIGQDLAQPSFNPFDYFTQNENIFTQQPYGFGARMYNDANYFRSMQGFGFQVPAYGMA